jgi:hypothetical protein
MSFNMQWNKIYWDQLRTDDVFRIRNYDGTTTEEYLATQAIPRKWKCVFKPWLGEENKTLCYLDMNGFCEVLR